MQDIIENLTRLAPDSALVGVVLAGILAIWRGWLVPRRSVDQLVEVQAERLIETRQREQEWRAAYQAAEEARRVLDGHVSDVVDSLRTVEALVRALPAAAAAAVTTVEGGGGSPR